MSVRREDERLRQQLAQLAVEADTGLAWRYALRPLALNTPSLYRRLRRSVSRLLWSLGLRRTQPHEPWLTELNHIDYGDAARPLLIWAVGIDRDRLRDACTGLRKWQTGSPGWAPVLVTDVADFEFFSRLNWLVEYVPSLSAPADGYSRRKLRYLAWRYRDVPALPVTAELKEGMLLEDFLID